MSYARFGDHSDVYIYEHVGGFIECCGCLLVEPENEQEIFGFYHANTAREILSHIDEHLSKGHVVPDYCIDRIKKEHPDLDAQIPPYVRSPEEEARFKQLMERVKKDYDAQHGS